MYNNIGDNMKIIIELLIVLFVLIIVILFLLYKVLGNKFKIINIKINKSKNKLKEAFNEKFNLIIKVIDILNDKKKFDENLYHDFLNIKLDEISLCNLNDILIDTDNKIELYLSQNEKIINNKNYKELNKTLNSLNTTIEATRKYYNINLKEYNKLIKKFPTSIVARIKKYNEKEVLNNNPNKELKIMK